MKARLRRIFSILCIFAMVMGCLAFSASAEDGSVLRVVTVKWVDEDNYEGLRPSTIQVKIGDTPIDLKASENWTGEAAAPSSAVWSAPEVPGYQPPEISGTDVAVITYTHTPETTDLAASVSWQDEDNAAGLRPDSIKIRLLADGKPFRSVVSANAKNGWTVSWEKLPVNAKETTTPVTYSIEVAEEPEYYTTSVSGTTVTAALETGTLSLQASVSGAPEGADVSGLRLTVSGPDPRMPYTLTYGEITGGTFSFGPVLPGAYLVRESNADSLVEGYVMDAANSRVADAVYVKPGEQGTLVFSYAYKLPELPDEEAALASDTGKLTIEILGPDPRMPVTITYADFQNGRYELDDLIPGEYVVVERNAETLVSTYTLTSDSVTGMALTVGRQGATATLVNRYVPGPTPEPDAEVIDIPVVKIWNDNDDKDGNRPASVTVQLYANGVLNEEVQITAADGWGYIFKDKPRFDENGEEIEYTVGESPVAWYITSINGTAITNIYSPEVTSASVRKVWNDNNNQQKMRPTSIAVTLLPVGTIYVLSEENGWSITVGNLPVRINGAPVTYSWTEEETVGYVRESAATEGIATVFTNRIVNVPKVPADQPQPKRPGDIWYVFEEYDTALGIPILINHVGDCFD